MKPAALLLALASLLASPAWSEDAVRPPLGLQQEVDRAERERRDALAENEDLARQLGEAQAARERDADSLRMLTGERDDLQRKYDAAQRELAEHRAALAQARTELGASFAARRLLEDTLAERGRTLQACAESNDRLVVLGNELMVKYRDKSCLDSLKQTQPYSGLKRVEIENLLAGWRKRVDADRMAPPAPPAPPAGAALPEPGTVQPGEDQTSVDQTGADQSAATRPRTVGPRGSRRPPVTAEPDVATETLPLPEALPVEAAPVDPAHPESAPVEPASP